MKRHVLLVVLSVLLAACGVGSPATPEAERPFFIDEVEMVITSVQTADAYGDQEPASSNDTFVIVNADLLSKPDTVELDDLDFMGAASLSGDWGRVNRASISRVSTMSGGDSLGSVGWVFVVPRTAVALAVAGLADQSFTLELTGGEALVLDTFLTEQDAAAVG